jgi:hypothetical protein
MILEMYRDIRSLLAHWWSSDRIRVSPNDGQLLRLQPGDLLTVAGVDAEVLSRLLIADEFLCLTCGTAAGPAELHIPIPPHRGPVGWSIAGVCRLLTEDEVQVWRRCMSRCFYTHF